MSEAFSDISDGDASRYSRPLLGQDWASVEGSDTEYEDAEEGDDALALGLVLLLAAHTQIALRQAPALPATHWAAAWLLVAHPRAGRAWVFWSVVWGAMSIVLWAVFLPPA